ncbi:hypothetical protein [Aquimarina algicola]|uniref:Uncharacterized protein n=1 Tax=Aquimarina algicola TaxID=2589995 RepID=A0A504J6H9_9FLAO|nr:hypothetical protein [Aquimarina algicola]TPN82310.1 hypothetical protein FHK87_23075 [Aquimarina algicola]
MKLITILISSFLCSISLGYAQEVPVPQHYAIMVSVLGDLDNDDNQELVVAYNTKEQTEIHENIPRELIIYKNIDQQWKLWKKSTQALYGSLEGGPMGDPFEDIHIKDGVLHISQSGGSSWKWAHTDKYRYQDDEFYLIGYRSLSGKICEYWKEVDYNLSIGKIIVKKEYENCENQEQEIYKRENETFYYKKKIRIILQNREDQHMQITTPKYKHKIHL